MVAMQETRKIAGEHAKSLIAAMTAAFAIGQIAGPLCVSYLAAKEGAFSVPLSIASLLLALSGAALWRGERSGDS